VAPTTVPQEEKKKTFTMYFTSFLMGTPLMSEQNMPRYITSFFALISISFQSFFKEVMDVVNVILVNSKVFFLF